MQRTAFQNPSPTELLERFLLGSDEELPPVELLRAVNLGAYAYTLLDQEHPARLELQADFRRATLRHIAIRKRIAGLVRAWNEAGIETLIFKGFHLAEFVYDIPARRPFNDVDVLIDPAVATEASRIAQELGWTEVWSAERASSMFAQYSQARAEGYDGHEVLNLEDVEFGLRLDVHRRLVHNEIGRAHAQERITRAAWGASTEVRWEDTEVRVPAPEDALLIGLALNRGWGRDEWQVKHSDLTDFRTLVAVFGLTRSDLERRARELGCLASLRVFLRRCDGFTGHLVLDPPTFAQRLWWGFRVVRERGNPALELALIRAWDAFMRLGETLDALPSVVWAARAELSAVAVADPRNVVAKPERSCAVLTYREWMRLKRSVRLAMKMAGQFKGDDDPRFLLAVWHALHRKGLNVRMKINPPGSSDRNHFTLEFKGQPLSVS